MGSSYLTDAVLYLISAVFSIYILLVVLRFLLQTVRADSRNPISRFLLTATNPPLRLLRRVIPGFAGIDWSTIVLMVSLQAIELTITSLITYGAFISFASLIVLSIAELLTSIIYIFIFVIFVHVLLSWINPGSYNPITVLLYELSESLLRPARRLLPPIHGIDLSPILVFVFLQLSLILLVRPLTDLARVLAG